MNRLIVTCLLGIYCAQGAIAQESTSTTRSIVEKHLADSARGDVDEVLSDYADDAVLIGPDGVVKIGKQAIRVEFEALLSPGSGSALTLTNSSYDGRVGYITWTMGSNGNTEVLGSDTFIVEDGKITVQTVVLNPVE